MYPNPAIDDLIIDFFENIKIAEIDIVSMTGELVYHQTERNATKSKININSILPGIYCIQMLLDNTRINKVISISRF